MAGAGVSVVAGQQQFRPVACTVCLDSPLKVPVFQCLNGHLLCFECEDRLDDCPTCKVTLKKNPNKKIRSLAVEEIQEQLFYCANFSDGCTHVFLDTESRIVHESICEVRATSGAAATGSSSGAGASLNRRSHLASTSTSAVRASSTPEVVDLPSSDNDQNLTDLNWTEFTVNDSDDEGTATSGEDQDNADEGEDNVDLETTGFQGDQEADHMLDLEDLMFDPESELYHLLGW